MIPAAFLALTDFGYLGAAVLDVAQLYENKRAAWTAFFAWTAFVAQTATLTLAAMSAIFGGTLSMTDWMDFLIWLVVGAYLIFGRRTGLSTAGAFIFPIVFVLWVLAAWLLERPLVVQTALLWIGAGFAAAAGAAFLLLAVFGIMYIEKERELAQKRVRLFYYQLPALDQLDSWTARLLGVGWPMLTAALAVSRLWGPGSTVLSIAPLILWVSYGIIIAGRYMFRWPGHRTAVGVMLAFLALVVEIYGIAAATAYPPLW